MVFPSSITKRAKERLRKKVGIQLLKIDSNVHNSEFPKKAR
jgi:hypothetical protein